MGDANIKSAVSNSVDPQDSNFDRRRFIANALLRNFTSLKCDEVAVCAMCSTLDGLRASQQDAHSAQYLVSWQEIVPALQSRLQIDSDEPTRQWLIVASALTKFSRRKNVDAGGVPDAHQDED